MAQDQNKSCPSTKKIVWIQQVAVDPEFGIDVPTEIRFLNGDVMTCLMTLEDWSDRGKVEPYSCSYAFSFYSYSEKVNELFQNTIRAQLLQEDEVDAVKVFHEHDSPKWYWSFLDMVKGGTFRIYASLGTLALLAIAMLIVSPSSSTCQKISQCRKFLHKVRTVMLPGAGKPSGRSFMKWHAINDGVSTNVSLVSQICEYCKEYSRMSGDLPFRTSEIEDVEYLIDPWGRPYNADFLDNFSDKEIKRLLADLTVNGIVMWSSGPNGINEHGTGDDVLELPKRKGGALFGLFPKVAE